MPNRDRKRKPATGQEEDERTIKPSLRGEIIDVVMPVFGEWDLAVKAIESIPLAFAGMNEGYRLILVDNGTPPWADNAGNQISPEQQSSKARSMLRKNDSFYRTDANLGYPGGCNFGASKGVSPLIVIWTADVVMETGSMARIVRNFDDPNVGVVGPLLVFPPDSPNGPPGRVQHSHLTTSIKGDIFHMYMGWNPNHPKVQAPKPSVIAVTGALFATRRSLFRDIGGFSGQYGGGTFEDVDYCFSVASKGFRIVADPKAVGTHYVGGSIKQGANKGGFQLQVNSLVFKGRWARALQWDEWRWW